MHDPCVLVMPIGLNRTHFTLVNLVREYMPTVDMIWFYCVSIVSYIVYSS